MNPGFFDHLFFLLISAVLPGFALIKGQKFPKDLEWDTHLKRSLYFSNSIALWIGATITISLWYFNEREMGMLGIQKGLLDSNVMLWALVLLGLYIVDASWKLLPRHIDETVQRWKVSAPFLPTDYGQLASFSVLAFSAAICEELIFRGFMMTYLTSLIGEGQFALCVIVGIPAIAFTIGHYYQGWSAMIRVFVGGVLFGWIFYISDSILIPIIVHAVIDLTSGYLSTKFAG